MSQVPLFATWETATLSLPITQGYAVPAHNGLEKPMKEVAAEVEGASALPGSIPQELGRSAPSLSNYLR
jgi:hypothetical protein